jgi:hypothetical protein
LDTAARETPASRATSSIVEGRGLLLDAGGGAEAAGARAEGEDEAADVGDRAPSGFGFAEVTTVFPIL